MEKLKMDKKEFDLLVSQMRGQGLDDDKIMHVYIKFFFVAIVILKTTN